MESEENSLAIPIPYLSLSISLLPIITKSVATFVYPGPNRRSWPLKFWIVFNIIKQFNKQNNENTNAEQATAKLIFLQKLTNTVFQQPDKEFLISETRIPRSKQAVDFMLGKLSSPAPAEAKRIDFEFENTNAFAGPGVLIEKMTHPNSSSERVCLMIHGGAYIIGSSKSHRNYSMKFAKYSKCTIYAVDYRLAPQNPFPCAVIDVISAYLHLLTLYSSKQIVFMGDSAGGGLCLVLALALRDMSIAMPAGLICMSPWQVAH